MAELNLKQITDKLNSEFMGEVRKLIFWYDANAEFAEDIDTLPLENVKVLHLERDNQFQTKVFLEREDTTTNYLVYAPFPKPDIRDNHLADTIRYSKEFFADRASLLALDLGLDERLKPVLQHYIKFFAEKKRTQAFYALEVENYTHSSLEIAMMSVLCKCKTLAFEEVVRCILTDDGFEDNKYLAEFAQFDLLEPFWRHCETVFGYTDAKPTLEKLVITTFVTYLSKTIDADIPQAWIPFVSIKSGNVLAFIDNLMNSYIYGEKFDEISEKVYESIAAGKELTKLPTDALLNASVFSGIDDLIIKWMVERLESEDTEAKLNGRTIPEVCALRRKLHFGQKYRNEYFVMENAHYIIKNSCYSPVSGLSNIMKRYMDLDYKMDRRYRYFYLYLDRIEDTSAYEKVRELVENIYTNGYLNHIIPNWCQAYTDAQGKTSLPKQTDFYNKYVRTVKERVVVIISDALRYDVGMTLFEKLQENEKCKATFSTMHGVLPSVTRFGMAALLPHMRLEYLEDSTVKVDGMPCADLKQREAILQKYDGSSCCVQYDDLKGLKVAELREIFAGKSVVYVYHNQIDARGDRLNTENEVFAACEEAVEEIFSLIRRLTTSANTSRFIVTADHGFIYKRDKLTESDKISGMSGAGKRYLVTGQQHNFAGVSSVPFNTVTENDDTRMLYFPSGSDIFKTPGAGLNYAHGGCSPQEMLIPVIDVKTEKGYREVTAAQITLVSLTTKITNLITTLDFLQTEPISDVVKETTYRIYFINEENEKISSENKVSADKKDKDAQKRMFRLRFSFKNQKYDKQKKYYLVAYDEKNDLEVLRREIIMDIAFADDFGFGLW